MLPEPGSYGSDEYAEELNDNWHLGEMLLLCYLYPVVSVNTQQQQQDHPQSLGVFKPFWDSESCGSDISDANDDSAGPYDPITRFLLDAVKRFLWKEFWSQHRVE